MSDKKESQEYSAPKGTITDHHIKIGKTNLKFKCFAEWTLLRKKEIPSAEMFSVAYIKQPVDKKRPLTFVFNGGPGASSVYLHLGALGPKRVSFGKSGELLPPPVQLVDNLETWLKFTDLVFLDPVGTGFSRTIDDVKFEKHPPKDEKEEKEKSKPENKDYYSVNNDLDSIGEFSERFLNKHGRWLSPIYLAGESYGGYRVGKLAKRIQETHGIGLCGAILISPALEVNLLDGSDYDVLTWVDVMPTMALSALHHAKSNALKKSKNINEAASLAEQFALHDLTRSLVNGDLLSKNERLAIYKKHSEFIGIDPQFLEIKRSRINFLEFSRRLLKNEGKALGLYDGSYAITDPFPDREGMPYPDPTLSGAEHVFASGINHLIRSMLNITTERRYKILSHEINTAWKRDDNRHVFEVQMGAADDLRYGMALNPNMKVWITHGWYDLVTPYFSSKRLVHHLKLTDKQKENVFLSQYLGGHMYYGWESSRRQFAKDAELFFNNKLKNSL